MSYRKIIHVDMDAFYASVEQRDKPELRGLPIAVGGSPSGRGVVAAASYEARKYGVHSAMSSLRAKRLCPKLVFVKPRFSIYQQVSSQIREIFLEHTSIVEPLSLDEAYLDVTVNKNQIPSATVIAKAIRKQILDTCCLTASAGVAPNKFIAKLASDMNKPNSLTVVPPSRVKKLLECLPVRKLPGVGQVTESRLIEAGILNTRDMRNKGENRLIELLGKNGAWFYSLANGVDPRPVSNSRSRKSMGVERTFSQDIIDPQKIEQACHRLGLELESRLLKRNLAAKTLTLKFRYADFSQGTRSYTLEAPISKLEDILSLAKKLLLKTEAGIKPIRLLGLSLSSFLEKNSDINSDLNIDLTQAGPSIIPQKTSYWQQTEFLQLS